jgi:hypothetical protein
MAKNIAYVLMDLLNRTMEPVKSHRYINQFNNAQTQIRLETLLLVDVYANKDIPSMILVFVEVVTSKILTGT